MELTGPEAITGDVAFMQAEQLVVDHLNESFTICCVNPLLCKTIDVADCQWFTQPLAYHGSHHLHNVLPVVQTEGIRFTE